MADSDININLNGGDDNNDELSKLRRDAEAAAEALQRFYRSERASQQRRNALGRFSGGYEDGGDGSGREGGTPRTPGGTTGPNPAGPNGPSDNGFRFRVEGLTNLLKGGSNIRLRGIQQITSQQIAQFWQAFQQRVLQAQGTPGLKSRAIVAAGRAITGLSRAAAGVGTLLANPVTLAIGGFVLAIGLAIAGLTKFYKRANAFAESLAKDIGTMSPALALAKSRASISDLRSRMDAGSKIGGSLGTQTLLNQQLTNEVREFRTNLFAVLAPFLAIATRILIATLALLNRMFEMSMKVVEILLMIISWMPIVGNVVKPLVGPFKRWLKDQEKEVPTTSEMAAKELQDVLGGLRSARPADNN